MTHLRVLLRFHGVPVFDRVVALRDGLTLGPDADDDVAFPGERLVVRRDPRGWTVGGRLLRRGEVEERVSDDVVLGVELIDEAPQIVPLDGVPDPLPLVLTVAVVLLALSWDTAARVADAHPGLADALRARLLAPR